MEEGDSLSNHGAMSEEEGGKQAIWDSATVCFQELGTGLVNNT